MYCKLKEHRINTKLEKEKTYAQQILTDYMKTHMGLYKVHMLRLLSLIIASLIDQRDCNWSFSAVAGRGPLKFFQGKTLWI